MPNVSVAKRSNESKQLEEQLLEAFRHLSIGAQRRETKLLGLVSRLYIGKTKAEIEAQEEAIKTKVWADV
jgi:hypothetical protein